MSIQPVNKRGALKVKFDEIRLSLPRIERVAQAVADQVERQHNQEDRKPRPDRPSTARWRSI
jgi:hypothetical protein